MNTDGLIIGEVSSLRGQGAIDGADVPFGDGNDRSRGEVAFHFLSVTSHAEGSEDLRASCSFSLLPLSCCFDFIGCVTGPRRELLHSCITCSEVTADADLDVCL